MKDSEENDPDKITVNTLLILAELKKLEEIILDQKDLKDGEFKSKDNQDIEDKFEKYPRNFGSFCFRLNVWVLEAFLQLVIRKGWKRQTSITKAMLLFIDHYEDDENAENTEDDENDEDEINDNN